MTDYSAHDIHLLDQAYPDALADIEAHIGDPNQNARLADKGTEVYAAELTRDLAGTATSPMSLAGWAAVATVRLMEAGRVWEEDTDAAWAKVGELTAELAKVREQLTAANRRADGAEADRDSLRKGHTAWANENARLREVAQQYREAMFGQHQWAGHLIHDDCPDCNKAAEEADGDLACHRYRYWQDEYETALSTYVPAQAATR